MTEHENNGASFPVSEEPIRVLMADDEETLLRATVELMRKEGIVCEHVSDGDTAIETARRAKAEGREFDVLVADYKMPGLDGIQVLDAVHSECPDTRVIILTGYPSVSSAIRALKGRAIDYLTKPFDV
ncbi:MAG: response regulator, partial [Spirochaetales bacterium]|nr:response regulator [Spirochaetales bacterium]